MRLVLFLLIIIFYQVSFAQFNDIKAKKESANSNIPNPPKPKAPIYKPKTMPFVEKSWRDNYSAISSFDANGRIAVVNLKKKEGYVDLNGNIVIPCIYERALTFREDIEGLGFVKLNSKWGAIDISGKEKIPFTYDDIDFLRNVIRVKLNGKWGAINTTGQTIVPFIFESSDFENNEDNVFSKIKNLAKQEANKGTDDGYRKAIKLLEPYVHIMKGNDTDLSTLGYYYVSIKDFVKATGYFRLSCERGSDQGCHYLANHYKNGIGVDINEEKAVEYYKMISPSYIYISSILKEIQQLETLVLVGIIKDDNGNPLPGVTIKIKGTSMGASTNLNGEFKIKLPLNSNGNIIVSFVGYKKEEFGFNQEWKYKVIQLRKK